MNILFIKFKFIRNSLKGLKTVILDQKAPAFCTHQKNHKKLTVRGMGSTPRYLQKLQNARLTNNRPHPTNIWGMRGGGGDGMSGRLCPNIGCITASIWPSLVNIFAKACVCANHETSRCDLCKQLMCTLLCQSQTCSFMTLLPPDRAQPLRSDR